ncbi:hypothetical protein BS50DRAFT_632829 [Corynespora cassiicola Philippines]|uniref:Uncharacterized protein n=1 Tax=Corynespora cassiicola Philippines TaxID=1448308 RepID=A0A2T2NUD9_CORCC|nr:hypothetical protein BS50DRAFT_632829 [Corynespora cassiicola Philippines]
MSTPQAQAVRRWILTGAITAITVTGAIYGAGLKSKQEFKQERKRVLEATPEDMIAQLQVARSELVNKKSELERKIARFTERQQEKERGSDTK